MGEIQVIRVDEDTVDGVCDFMQPVYADSYPNDTGITRHVFEGPVFGEHLRGYLAERVQSEEAELYVGSIGDTAIGSIGIEIKPETPKVGEIWGFYVATEQQSRGIGRFLWNDLMTRPQVEKLELLKLVVAKNLFKAIDFYSQEGFYVSGEECWNWPSWTEPKGRNEYWIMER